MNSKTSDDHLFEVNLDALEDQKIFPLRGGGFRAHQEPMACT